MSTTTRTTMITLTCLALLAALLCPSDRAMADVPPVLNHQGMLTDAAGLPLEGEFFMSFRLYEQAADGTEIWGETQRVDVEAGVFNVYLGEVEPLDDQLFVGQDIWLGVTVEDDGEMTPRLRMGSVLYAFTADNQGTSGQTWYQDLDGDGYGNPAVSQTSFTRPEGYVGNGGDCDDGNPDINPAAEEFCDGIDSDCDGQDANGLIGPPCDLQLGVCGGATRPCGGVQGWLPCGPEQYGPNFEATEISCDGRDNDCDGAIDENVNCDDANPCTGDSCGGAVGCIHQPLTGQACDDGNPCTINDTCDGMGNCVGTPINCDDGNPCTLDYCDPAAGCMHVPQAGLACDDGDPCTVNDQCDGAGLCTGMPIDCDDGIPCTLDMCDGTGGCIHELQPGVCLIDGVCYADGQPNPFNECQECNAAAFAYGWTDVMNGTPCADGQCENGACVPLYR